MPNNLAAAEEPRLDLARFLPYRLSVLTNRVSSAIARHYSERFGLSIPEWRVMAVLGSVSDLSAREVASRTAMDKVQVSRAVASLLKARRVQRKTDPGDGRIGRLSLTLNGRAIYDEIVPLALHLEALLLSALSGDEKLALDRVMVKLARQVNLLQSTHDWKTIIRANLHPATDR
jgi:DNA-binding MarR family transcriptional regulator